AERAGELADHRLDRRRLRRVVVPEARGESVSGGRLRQRLDVKVTDLQLLAVEVYAEHRGALAEEQLKSDRPGDAVGPAEDQDRGAGGDPSPGGTDGAPLARERFDGGVAAVRGERLGERASVETAERELLEDFEGHRSVSGLIAAERPRRNETSVPCAPHSV